MAIVTYENIFDAVTMNPKEAEDLKLRANILISLRRKMNELKLTQLSASEALEISIDEVQQLSNGEAINISKEKLLTYMDRLNHRYL